MLSEWPKSSPKILILGAGCTGLGAAYRLHELGYSNFRVLEKNDHPGGLAASYVDDQGFTWDLGGHVQFSHYEYFDRLMELALGSAWLHHVRESYIWIRDRFIPYPFQNNLQSLPTEDLVQCLKGLIGLTKGAGKAPANFHDWILGSFGAGIADLFMLPYNFKVWAHPAEMMSTKWVGERVATVNLEKVVENVIRKVDEPSWGPNNTFRFPAAGGTGAIWKNVAGLIPQEHLTYDTTVQRIDRNLRRVYTSDNQHYDYDVLISTIPVGCLTKLAGMEEQSKLAAQLKYSSTHVIGVGLEGQAPPELSSKNWMYYPEANCPFYRVTVFSNYSSANVPEPSRQWSLMAEVAESAHKPVRTEDMICDVVRGMVATRLIRDEGQVVSTWYRRLEHGYPTPTVNRDAILHPLLDECEKHSLYSRGRFGAWKYEVANQDHSCMQGVEVVNRILFDLPEMTINYPAVVNGPKTRA